MTIFPHVTEHTWPMPPEPAIRMGLSLRNDYRKIVIDCELIGKLRSAKIKWNRPDEELWMIDQAAQRSVELFRSGFYCAESVLLAIAESKGIQSDLIPKIATGFCGGISRTCGICGAVSGAIAAISLFTGRNSPTETVQETYDTVRRLLSMFESKFGSTNCKDLVGCDLGTEEGQRKFKEGNLIEHCRNYTQEATRMAMVLIDGKRWS
jgi:C_GCAxxG_C_C family probable redox protein